MKKEQITRILIAVFVFGFLVLSGYVFISQEPTGAATPIGNFVFNNVSKETSTTTYNSEIIALIAKKNSFLNDNVAWGIFMCCLLVGTGVFYSIRLGFMQFTKFGAVMQQTVVRMVKRDKQAKKGELTPFQAFCTAMAGTVGTGNIAGVTGAIVLGGPGAVFWMWVAALFGMLTKYAEIVLAVHFREKDKNDEWVGGPMYYIKNGMGKNWTWLAVVFAVLATIASFGIGCMTQANTIAGTFLTAVNSVTASDLTGTSAETWIRLGMGLFVAICVGIVVIGGLKRMGRVTETIIPFMSLLYIILSIIVIAANYNNIGMAFGAIFQSAFTTEACIGGVSGFVFMKALQKGVGRGVFSNEAGLGSAPIAHATTSETNPVKQGLYGIFEVFVDTIIICTMTALVVLTANVVPWGVKSMAGCDTTILSFATVFGDEASSIMIAIALFFFAFSTILGWSLYGSRCFGFLTKGKFVLVYQIVFLVLIVIGSTMDLSLAWNISDTLNGFMAAPNLIALLCLSGVVVKLTKEYFNKKK